MSDSFREVTGQSWFSRIGNAIKGVLFGLLLVIVAFPLLFWNEGRAVNRAKTLALGEKNVISVPADKVDGANEGKLVYVSADAAAKEPVKDPVLGISAPALRLERQVQMYQWKETKTESTSKNVGGGSTTTTTYTYNKVWDTSLIASPSFKEAATHVNPAAMRFTGDAWDAAVTVGAFTLPGDMLHQLPASTVVPATDAASAGLPEAVKGSAKIVDGMFYIGKDAGSPEIGDLKVSFHAVPAGPVSLVAKQHASTFEPYIASTGGKIVLIQPGTVSAEALFKQAEAENAQLTWILRAVGFIMFLIGFVLIFKPLSVLADVLPFLGNLVGMGTGLIAFLLAVVCTALTIAVGWLFYRPLIAIPLLLVALGGIVLALRFLFKRKAVPLAGATGTTAGAKA